MAGELHVVVVGQTPPPHGGQAVMIQALLDGRFRGVRLHHVRMNFSREMDEIGRFRWHKVAHLLAVTAQVVAVRVRWNAAVLYYPPAGPQPLPVARDVLVLASTRWMFRSTLLHFHAAGLCELYPKLHPLLRAPFRWAYFRPEAAVRLSTLTPDDAGGVQARQVFVVPYGIAGSGDQLGTGRPSPGLPAPGLPEPGLPAPGLPAPGLPAPGLRPSREVPVILYVGILHESKGVLVLLEACRELRRAGLDFRLELVGAFTSEGLRRQVDQALATDDLGAVVRLRGVLTGDAKERAYDEADIFCFPSFFEAEAFPVVLLEALRAGLPVVATRWRAIPEIVRDGENGWIVPPADAGALAGRLGRLVTDRAEASRMGRAGRARFEADYTLSRFHERMQEVFDAVALSRTSP